MKFPKFTALLFAGSLMLSVAACGKPSVEGSDKSYKANKDKLSVLITKQPGNKAEFEKKIAEFETEYQTAMKAGTDEEKIKKLDDLNSRMGKYITELEKGAAAAPAGGAAAPSGKLDGAGGAPATAPAGGGKLGGDPAAAGGTGMGGGTQPASGGMGGGTPPPATPPAGGGMGGM